MATSSDGDTADLLKQVLVELRTMNELLESFTNDGFPLTRALPTTEMLAALVMAAALVMRENPRINQNDLQQRLAAAPILSQQLIAQVDAYLQSVERQQLEALSRR